MTFLDELIGAARGCLGLVVGDKQSSSYFDFRQTGLVGSFIALVVSLAIQAFGPQLLGVPTPPGISMGVVILGGLVTAVQFGVAYAVLRQLGRNDGFVPFVVVQNWATLFQAAIAVGAIGILGQPIAMDSNGVAQLTNGSIPFIMLGIAALVVSINIGRLILTLKPLHVGLFVISQMVTALVAQAFLGSIL